MDYGIGTAEQKVGKKKLLGGTVEYCQAGGGEKKKQLEVRRYCREGGWKGEEEEKEKKKLLGVVSSTAEQEVEKKKRRRKQQLLGVVSSREGGWKDGAPIGGRVTPCVVLVNGLFLLFAPTTSYYTQD